MTNSAQTIANTSTGISIGSGTLTAGATFTEWVTANATFIGICITLLSALVAIAFHIINNRQDKKHKQKMFSLEKAQTITEMRSKGMSEPEIQEILKLAGVDNA